MAEELIQTTEVKLTDDIKKRADEAFARGEGFLWNGVHYANRAALDAHEAGTSLPASVNDAPALQAQVEAEKKLSEDEAKTASEEARRSEPRTLAELTTPQHTAAEAAEKARLERTKAEPPKRDPNSS